MQTLWFAKNPTFMRLLDRNNLANHTGGGEKELRNHQIESSERRQRLSEPNGRRKHNAQRG
jgi:hypothetical protein